MEMKIIVTEKENMLAVENARNEDNYMVEKCSIADSFTVVHECDGIDKEEAFTLHSLLGHYNVLLDTVHYAEIEEGNSLQQKYGKAVADWMDGETKESISELNDALLNIKEFFIGMSDDVKAMQISNAAELVNRILLCEKKGSQG
nr:hypothetical protein [uncultured Prevotella sp.]